MLVATDVVGRGIDVSSISHIINFDMPQFSDDYVHRVGRTGRMGRDGIAFTFVTPEEGNRTDADRDADQQAADAGRDARRFPERSAGPPDLRRIRRPRTAGRRKPKPPPFGPRRPRARRGM